MVEKKHTHTIERVRNSIAGYLHQSKAKKKNDNKYNVLFHVEETI
jgi:ribosomal protein S17E